MSHIIVVDDEANVRDLISDVLTSFGHTVDSYVNGLQGYNAFQIKPADLVLAT